MRQCLTYDFSAALQMVDIVSIEAILIGFACAMAFSLMAALQE
jgi:hypothetical protein